ncbi:MAG: hypothetical protein ACOCQR_02375 [bacterium]
MNKLLFTYNEVSGYRDINTELPGIEELKWWINEMAMEKLCRPEEIVEEQGQDVVIRIHFDSEQIIGIINNKLQETLNNIIFYINYTASNLSNEDGKEFEGRKELEKWINETKNKYDYANIIDLLEDIRIVGSPSPEQILELCGDFYE